MNHNPAKNKIVTAQNTVRTPRGTYHYTLKRSHKRRSLEIVISESGEIGVAAPLRMKSSEIDEFIIQKASWIVRQIERASQRQRILKSRSYTSGQEFLFLGRKFPLSVQPQPVRRSRILFNEEGWRVTVPFEAKEEQTRNAVKKKLVDWYRRQAKEILGSRVFHFARLMDLDLNTVGIRSQKSIWGSCHIRNRAVHLNWQLVMMPIHVIDYIVVHELAHLFHGNHSKRFWNKVAKVLPDFRQRQAWIRHNRLDLILP